MYISNSIEPIVPVELRIIVASQLGSSLTMQKSMIHGIEFARVSFIFHSLELILLRRISGIFPRRGHSQRHRVAIVFLDEYRRCIRFNCY